MAIAPFPHPPGRHVDVGKDQYQRSVSDKFDARQCSRSSYPSEMASLNNRRRTDVVGPYLLLESTLDACLQEFVAKPAPMRHLYEVHTSPQPIVGECRII